MTFRNKERERETTSFPVTENGEAQTERDLCACARLCVRVSVTD